jgi:hypothetical protein
MAGLAATLNAPGTIDALTEALAPRGPDSAVCRLDARRGSRLDISVRAAMPGIARVADGTGNTVAAFGLDGVASVTALDQRYADRGPLGLLSGRDPYAAVVADADRDELLLARNGDGPGLYYARLGDGWVCASEPRVLLYAGVPSTPDEDVVRRFLETGESDDGPATFFTHISRVMPGEVIVLGRGGEADSHVAAVNRPPVDLAADLADAVTDGRVGIRLTPGLPGAALLGVALTQIDHGRPLPVHTVTVGAAASTPAVLAPMPHGRIRHVRHTLEPSELDVDAYLTDMGEPVPDLDLLQLWLVARNGSGNADVIVDASGGSPNAIARVSDRLESRYGVSVRSPLRDGTPISEDELEMVVSRTLSPNLRRYIESDSTRPAYAADLLTALGPDVAAALATPGPLRDEASDVESLRRLHAGEAVDADALWRAYLVERWLRLTDSAAADREPVEDMTIEGVDWARLPVWTNVIGPGDQVAPRAAWCVATAFSEHFPGGPPSGPWFAALSAKVVAMGQRRVRSVLDITPGRRARVLSRLARHRLPRLGQPWTMQIALDDGGALRVAAASLAAALGLRRWAGRLLPEGAAAICPPRPVAVPPADAAVVRAPVRPDDAAEALLDALRLALPPSVMQTLAGCAVVAADESGCRVLGFAPGPYVEATARPEALIERLCADNPAGQAAELTPVVLALQAPRPHRTRDDRQNLAGVVRHNPATRTKDVRNPVPEEALD